MDKNQISTATIGGHGFGAKVATATATDNLNRFTGVMWLDGGPVDQTYHPAFVELKNYILKLSKINIAELDKSSIFKKIDLIVEDSNWNKIFKDNVNFSKGAPQWNFNFDGLHKNVKKVNPDVSAWSESYGLWPGRAWAQIASYSNWIHLSTNTLPFYNVFPRLQGRFPSPEFNIFGNDTSPASHWMHHTKDESEAFHLANRMWRWLKTKDGVHVLLNDRSEVGWKYLPDRGVDSSLGTSKGEFTPEHVHHNYRHTRKFLVHFNYNFLLDVYEKSRRRREVEGSAPNQFLPRGQWSPEAKW